MKNKKYYEKDELNSKEIVSNISDSLKQMEKNISELEKSKQKTDGIIEKFDIDCYKYNLVEEMSTSKERLIKNLKNVIDKLNYINKNKDTTSPNFAKKIDYINDILNDSNIQLKGIEKEYLNDVEILQMNAIKMAIYNKYMLLKSDIDRSKLKEKFDKMQNINALHRGFIKFFYLEEGFDMKKENLFMQIKEIDRSREEFSKITEPEKEYKIIEILADISLFLMETPSKKKYRNEIKEIKQIKRNIEDLFYIDNKKLKEAIADKRRAKLPVKVNKKINKMIKEREKAIAFLDRNGYINPPSDEENAIKSSMKNVIRKINIISESIEKIIRAK